MLQGVAYGSVVCKVGHMPSMTCDCFGERFELEKVWVAQDISAGLKGQIQVWAREVNDVLHRSAAGRMVSEWAKKSECWAEVRAASFSPPASNITEVTSKGGALVESHVSTIFTYSIQGR